MQVVSAVTSEDPKKIPPFQAFERLRAAILSHAHLKESLRRASVKGAVFIPNGGNLGDGLIHLGTTELFSSIGIDFPTVANVTPQTLAGVRMVVLGGGGAWLEGVWEHWARMLRGFLDLGGEAILLPSTVDGFGEYFDRYSEQIEIFAREKTTFETLQSRPRLRSRVDICPDLAFAVDPQLFQEFRNKSKRGELKLFRTDAESLSGSLPPGNIDLAHVWNGPIWQSRESCLGPIRAAANIISGFETVNTDRLHMTVLSAMVGCTVNMYIGNYYKNQAVYDYSLREVASITYKGQRVTVSPGEETGASAPEPIAIHELRKELVTLARLRRDWFEPELERLYAAMVSSERTKTEWYEPELARLASALEETARTKTDWYEPELVRLHAVLADAERTKTEWYEPELQRLQTALSEAELSQTNRFEPELARLTSALEEAERWKTDWFEPELARRARALEEVERTSLDWYQPELERLQSSLTEAERVKAEWFEPEISRLSQSNEGLKTSLANISSQLTELRERHDNQVAQLRFELNKSVNRHETQLNDQLVNERRRLAQSLLTQNQKKSMTTLSFTRRIRKYARTFLRGNLHREEI